MSDEELVKMARLAQRDDRMATGALYGDLADRIEALTAKLAKAVELLIVCRDMFDEVAHPSDPLSKMLNDMLAEIEGEKG
jgi:hypothetical protein